MFTLAVCFAADSGKNGDPVHAVDSAGRISGGAAERQGDATPPANTEAALRASHNHLEELVDLQTPQERKA